MNSAQYILLALVRAYRLTVSPAQRLLFGPLSGCRFTPSCSEYGAEAIRTHGAAVGSWLTFKRICRCHPWGGCGHDPVPTRPTSFHPRSRGFFSKIPLLIQRAAKSSSGQHGS